MTSLPLLLVAALQGLSAVGMPAQGLEGCYRFDSPLSYSASGDLERGDSSWYLVELKANGKVSRPLFRLREGSNWERASTWRLAVDTLVVVVHDGLVGWSVNLLANGNSSYRGEAVYHTDVRSAGWKPPRKTARATRSACPPPPPQSRQEIERIATLGRVWGLLKYYHSGVAAGRVDWDSVLVAAFPEARIAGPMEYRRLIQSLLTAAGDVPDCGMSVCPSRSPDSMRINLDLRWIEDTTLVGSGVARQLARLRDNPHRGPGRYVSFVATAMFDADTAFSAPAYPAEGQRLLALFRFWNAARYYFPYMYVNGGDWNVVLAEFIPRMVAARDAEAYHLAIAELTTRLRDAHVSASSVTLTRFFGARLPPFEARFIEGKVTVWRPTPDVSAGLLPGDVITHIDGVSVADRRRDLGKYVAAGNGPVFERKLLSLVLRTNGDSATYTVDRDGDSLIRRVPIPPPATRVALPSFPVVTLARVLPNTNIGYIDMGRLDPAQVDSAIAIVAKTDGIVMDVRNYPRGTMYRFAEFFNPEARPFARFTAVDRSYPGQVVWMPPVAAGRAGGNPDFYRGRVAILIDERTQSHAEFTTMALRTAPSNKVIGSQTAGADGNVTFLSLPGGIRTVFTGLGVYYPDGTPTQRIGIVPDIEIRPTLDGLRAGRDEVLERAIQYIRTGR
jgi:carboxyl-terminal processing protease